MRKLIKSAVIAAVTVPVLLAAAGVASADAHYGQASAEAGPQGASSSGTFSDSGHAWGHDGWGHEGWNHDGWGHWFHEGPSYLQACEHADSHGASSSLTAAGVDGWGRSHFLHSDQQAGQDGASSDTTLGHS